MLKNMKLKTKILACILGFCLIVLSLLCVINIFTLKNTLLNENREHALEKVIGSANKIEIFFKEKGRTAWTFCQNPQVIKWLEQNTKRRIDHTHDQPYQQFIQHFKNLVKSDPDIKSVFLACENTQEYFDHEERDPGEDYYVGQRPWYQRMVGTKEPVYDIDVDLLDQQIYCAYQYPIYNEQDQFLGVGGIDISMETLEQTLSELQVFKSSTPFLIGKDGTFFYHPDQSLIREKTIFDLDDGNKFKNISESSREMIKGETGSVQVIYNGEKHNFIYTPVQSLNAILVLSVPLKVLNSTLMQIIRNSLLTIVIASFCLIFGILLITNLIVTPILSLSKTIAESTKNKDLTVKSKIDTHDEVGMLAKGFNGFLDTIQEMIQKMKQSASIVSTTSQDISATAQQMAAGAEDQTDHLNNVMESISDILQVIISNSNEAKATISMTEQVGIKAQNGSKAILKTQDEMREIVQAAKEASDIVKSLMERAAEIENFTRLISDVAEQTNLLSLNASIEAVKAGDHGRGFAVVAGEVRKLAERTADSTTDIDESIKSIQADIQNAIQAVLNVVKIVKRGEQVTEETKSIFDDISDSMAETVVNTQEIASMFDAQCGKAESLTVQITKVNGISKNTAEGASNVATSIHQLNQMADELHQLVSQFVIDENGHDN